MGVALREIIASFGITVDDSQLKKADGLIEKSIGSLKTLAGAFLASKLVQGVASFVDSSIHMGEELEATALRLGLSTDQLQRWQFAARVANVNTETLAGAMNFLNRNAAETARGGGPAAEAFQRLGISVKDASGRIKDTNALMMEAAAAIAAIPDPANRTAAAMDIFGRSGAELLPLLAKGADGIAKLQEQVEEFGGGLSTEFVHASAEAGAAMAKWNLILLGVRNRIAVVLLPIVARLVEGVARIGAAFLKLAEHSHVVEAVFVVLGAAALVLAAKMVAAFFVPLLIFAAIAAAVAAIVLIVDDLITLFTGGESAIGAFIDQIFGVGAAAAFVEDMKRAWEDLKMVIGVVASVVTAFIVDLPAKIGTIVQDFTTGWNAIASGFGAAIDWIAQKWQIFYGWISPALNFIGQALSDVAGFIRGGDQPTPARGGQRLASDRTNVMDVPAFMGFAATGAGGVNTSAGTAAVPGARGGRTLAQIRQANRTHIEVHGTADAQQTAALVAQHVERIQSEEREAALATLEPEIQGSGFEEG